MRPPSIMRTKHRPRWPSCRRQSRGQRSHWTRPSSSVCHHLACIELHHPVAPQLAAPERGVGRKACLALELAQERPRLGYALPYLRQEGRPAAVGLHDETIAAGRDLLEKVRFIAEAQAPRRRKQRHLHLAVRPFVRFKRAKTRIAKRRAERILDDIVAERFRRLEAADAASQLALLRERDEARPGLTQPRRLDERPRLAGEPFLDGVARKRNQGGT